MTKIKNFATFVILSFCYLFEYEGRIIMSGDFLTHNTPLLLTFNHYEHFKKTVFPNKLNIFFIPPPFIIISEKCWLCIDGGLKQHQTEPAKPEWKPDALNRSSNQPIKKAMIAFQNKYIIFHISRIVCYGLGLPPWLIQTAKKVFAYF